MRVVMVTAALAIGVLVGCRLPLPAPGPTEPIPGGTGGAGVGGMGSKPIACGGGGAHSIY